MDKKRELISLKIQPEDLEFIQDQEMRLLRSMTILESIQQYQELQAAFEWQMQQTAGLFEANHWQALTELQDRLFQFKRWQSKDGHSLSLDPEDLNITQ
jgi:hypothetical protein